MSEGYVASDVLEDIEDAIRYKLGTQDDYSPPEMPEAIMSIPQSISGRVGPKEGKKRLKLLKLFLKKELEKKK